MGDRHQSSNNETTVKNLRFCGKIWVSTTNGSCSYQCIFCDCIFVSAISFERHIPIEHCGRRRPAPAQPPPLPPLPPPPQQQAEMRRKSLCEHALKAAPQPNVKQSADNRKQNEFDNTVGRSRNRINVERRRETYDRDVKAECKLFVCTKCDCGHKFNNLESLRDHVRRRHSYQCAFWLTEKNGININTTTTNSIRKTFETEKGLWSHQRTHHMIEQQFPYRCDVCVRAFVYRQQWRDHMEDKHVRGNDVKCDFCPKVLMSMFQKKNHIRRQHSDRRYYCFLCKFLWFYIAFRFSESIDECSIYSRFMWFLFRHQLSDNEWRQFEASHKGETSQPSTIINVPNTQTRGLDIFFWLFFEISARS